MRKAVDCFINEVKDSPYETSPWEFVAMGTKTPSKFEREHLYRDVLDLERDIADIEHDLRERTLTVFQTRALISERDELKSTRQAKLRALQETDRSVFERREEKWRESIVCSELVSALYQRMGLLPAYPLASSHVPKDFSTEGAVSLSVRGAKLLPEEYIDLHFDDATRLLRIDKEHTPVRDCLSNDERLNVKRSLSHHLSSDRRNGSEVDEVTLT